MTMGIVLFFFFLPFLKWYFDQIGIIVETCYLRVCEVLLKMISVGTCPGRRKHRILQQVISCTENHVYCTVGCSKPVVQEWFTLDASPWWWFYFLMGRSISRCKSFPLCALFQLFILKLVSSLRAAAAYILTNKLHCCAVRRHCSPLLFVGFSYCYHFLPFEREHQGFT